MFRDFRPGHEKRVLCPHPHKPCHWYQLRDLNTLGGKVPHRWKNNLDDRLRALFGDAADHLKWAWGVDRKHPKSYPINTDHAFWEIREQVKTPTREVKRTKLKLPPPPTKVSDLVDEVTIKAIYEDQNTDSYREALKEAAGFQGSRAWHKIWRAINAAYFVRYGDDFIPMPRVHFLHRRLLQLANSEPLTGLTLVGLVEFLDDMCPCGKKHKVDAIRKLEGRITGHRKR